MKEKNTRKISIGPSKNHPKPAIKNPYSPLNKQENIQRIRNLCQTNSPSPKRVKQEKEVPEEPEPPEPAPTIMYDKRDMYKNLVNLAKLRHAPRFDIPANLSSP